MLEGFTVLLSICLCVTLVLILFGCVCGCRKDVHKSELVGTAGVVKLHSEEEASATSQTSPVSAKRTSGQNQRSLPEIPLPVPRQDSGDTTSDLYATVGTQQRISEQSSPTPTRISEYPYEHAYARLQDDSLRAEDSTTPAENAVASGSSSNNTIPIPLVDATPEDSQSSNDAVVIAASVAISGQVSSSRDLPYMTPPVVVNTATHTAASSSSNQPPQVANNAVIGPENRAPQHFSGDSVDSAKGYTSISVREPLSSIRAVTNSQPHYATVSDDSDEMYAAIDEPANANNQVYTSGSETYAQIQPVSTVRTQVTLHQPPQPVATTSDPVPSTSTPPVFTGVAHSSTNSTVEAVHHVVDTAARQVSGEAHKQNIITNHTRQASNSSCNSSVGTVGSPKPEKRQANSPLPPTPGPLHRPDSAAHTGSSSALPTATVAPPTTSTAHGHRRKDKGRESAKQRISSTGDLHNHPEKLRRSLNEKHQRNNSCVSSSDFYGCNYPVDKHRYSSGDLAKALVAKELNFSLDNAIDKQKDALYNTIDGNDIYAAIDQSPPKSLPNVTSSPSKNVEEMYAKVIKKSRHSQEKAHSLAKLLNNEDVEAGRKPDHGGVKLRKKSNQHDEDRLSGGNFTSIPMSNDNTRNSSSPKNLSIIEDPGYETIDRIRNKNHSYETIDKKKVANRNSDPGYETVKDPGKTYDTHKYNRIATVSGLVAQHSHHMIGMEPGYETLPSGPHSIQSNDPGYEHIRALDRRGSDVDPNYEELTHKGQPSYAVINKSSIAGYSVINKKPKVGKDWSINNNENFSSEPNYESMPHEPFYTTGSETDSNYETVGPKDPNYESVKYIDLEKGEPPYEKVKNVSDSGSKVRRTGSSSSGYERVKNILKREEDQNDNRTNGVNASGDMAPVGDYFHV